MRPLAVAVRALLLTAGALPWLPWFFSNVSVLAPLEHAVEAWFTFQCHREPERSLLLSSRQLPVCARCFGIYLGLGLGALFLRPRLSSVWLRLCVGFAALLMLLDVLTETLHMRPESALLRAGTGLLLAWPISVQVALLARARSRRVD